MISAHFLLTDLNQQKDKESIITEKTYITQMKLGRMVGDRRKRSKNAQDEEGYEEKH